MLMCNAPGYCRRSFCPWDHEYAEELWLARQACPPAIPQAILQQPINSFQRPMQQIQQASHQPFLSCCNSHLAQGPHSLGPQGPHPISHMTQRSDCESVYSQESHQSSYFNHQPRWPKNTHPQGNNQQHQEAQYRSSNYNLQRERSQSSSYNSSGKYHESPNVRQGN